MIVDALQSELLHAAIVGVADERDGAVRLGVGLDELEHALETRDATRRQPLAVPLEQQVAT